MKIIFTVLLIFGAFSCANVKRGLPKRNVPLLAQRNTTPYIHNDQLHVENLNRSWSGEMDLTKIESFLPGDIQSVRATTTLMLDFPKAEIERAAKDIDKKALVTGTYRQTATLFDAKKKETAFVSEAGVVTFDSRNDVLRFKAKRGDDGNDTYFQITDADLATTLSSKHSGFCGITNFPVNATIKIAEIPECPGTFQASDHTHVKGFKAHALQLETVRIGSDARRDIKWVTSYTDK